MFKVDYYYVPCGTKHHCLFDNLDAVCCFLACSGAISFVVSSRFRRVIASTRSMTCTKSFLYSYGIWCNSSPNPYHSPNDFRLK